MNRLDVLEYRYSNSNLMCKFDYGYDIKSNVASLQRDDTGAGGSSKYYTFGYDNISRLVSASYGDETVSYSYDNAGNRLTLNSSVDGLTSYTIASNSNQLNYRSKVPEDPVFTNMSYTYDAEGNLTQRGSGNNYDSLSFQSFGYALKQIQKVRGGSVQETISYGYDGMGQRVKMTDSQGTQYFLYDGLMPVLELDSGKNTTASYVYGANGVIYRRLHLPGGDEYEYHHINALGSVAIITDDDESVAARYEYDAFGAVRHQWGDSDNTRKFTGKEYDADVKLYYYGARYYDPYIGRFISRDPAGDGINWYAYCRNNPLSLVDPTGLKVLEERKVNDIEREALIFTFGEPGGNMLADIITVRIVTVDDPLLREDRLGSVREVDGRTYVVLAEGYDPDNSVKDLGIFVHEATHYWQRLTGLHRGGKSGENYDYTVYELLTLQLDREEHAQAVQDWFVLTWLYDKGLVNPNAGAALELLKGNTSYKDSWRYVRSKTQAPTIGRVVSWANAMYSRVIRELRNTPILLQNYPNPF